MNDHIVRDFDPNDIPGECFGGEDVFTGYNMMQMKSMKWRNAYLLFYERKVPQDQFMNLLSDEEKEGSLVPQQSVNTITTTADAQADSSEVVDIEM